MSQIEKCHLPNPAMKIRASTQMEKVDEIEKCQNFIYLLMGWAVFAHRTAKSPLIFMDRATVTINIPLMRHQFVTNFALEFFVKVLQVMFHFFDGIEEAIAHRTSWEGSDCRHGRIRREGLRTWPCCACWWWPQIWWWMIGGCKKYRLVSTICNCETLIWVIKIPWPSSGSGRFEPVPVHCDFVSVAPEAETMKKYSLEVTWHYW